MPLDQDLDGRDPSYYYTILNLPSVASDYEIRERYRQLSIQFHPDKQHDEATKEIASRQFLKVQKAYQVLSDPFLRSAYDALGEAGLRMDFPDDIYEKSSDEIKSELKALKRKSDVEKLEDLLGSKSRLTIGIDARSICDGASLGPLAVLQKIGESVQRVSVSHVGFRHSIQQKINEKTRMRLTSHVTVKSIAEGPDRGRANFNGTISHQYSPRLNFELVAPLLRQPWIALKTNYNDNENELSVQTRLSSAMLHNGTVPLPPYSIMYSRRLFPTSATQGVITLDTMSTPSLGINLLVPASFDFTPSLNFEGGPFPEESPKNAPIENALAKGTSYYSVGIAFAGVASGIRTEWGVVLSRLALHFRVGATLGILGINYWISGSWDSPAQRASIDGTVTANVQGVSLSLHLRYLGQHLNLPIVLSSNNDPNVVFYTTIVPAVVSILGYHFIYQPRQVKKQLNHIHKLRRELQSSVRAQEANEVKERIIKETARRHVQTEQASDGLLIETATYGCALAFDEARDLMIDVTTPLQSLVHRSQLYIPGQRTKSNLQGFYDPAPQMPKVLRIKYRFRGREHYAEIQDSLPVVLPLAEHHV